MAGGGTRKFHFAIRPRGLGDERPAVWSRGEGSIGGLGDEVPQKLNQLAEILFTKFDCRNDQNLKISYNSPPDSCPLYQSRTYSGEGD